MVAIAASTGGPPALEKLLKGLSSDFPVPILLVQHIADGFVEGFANWLHSAQPLNVKVAEDGDILQPGTVYVAPHERHLGVTRTLRASLSDGPSIDGFRPSASLSDNAERPVPRGRARERGSRKPGSACSYARRGQRGTRSPILA